jgi:glycerol-3-phosphate dehydrogenase
VELALPGTGGTMKRNVRKMPDQAFDLLVVGGGIYGLCTAWEAALRGLSVGLVERGDFGAGTTANSLRTIHGGLRYLQHADLRRMRQSIRERRHWLRVAPGLVKPQSFALPTSGRGMKSPAVFRLALQLNDAVSLDRDEGVAPSHVLPAGRVVDDDQGRRMFDGLKLPQVINGAAVWYDAICLSSERLSIEVAHAACELGARLVNYAEALSIEQRDGPVHSVRVRDRLRNEEHVLRARAVINATGPDVDAWLARFAPAKDSLFRPSKAFNLLTRRFPFSGAIGVSVPRGARDPDAVFDRGANTFFIMPWKGHALIGTRHLRCESGAATTVTASEVRDFVDDLNVILGKSRLAYGDVVGVYSGVLPEKANVRGSDVVLEKRASVVDHGARGGPRGLYSIVGVKWTTSRLVAAQAVERVCRHLGHPGKVAARHVLPGAVGATSVPGIPTHPLPCDAESFEHIRALYGHRAAAVLALAVTDPLLSERLVPACPVIGAQVAYAARHEMAMELSDVVLRRTELSFAEGLDEAALRAAARLMGRELGWGQPAIDAQTGRALAQLGRFRMPLS